MNVEIFSDVRVCSVQIGDHVQKPAHGVCFIGFISDRLDTASTLCNSWITFITIYASPPLIFPLL